VEEMAKGLNLDDAQKEKLRAIFAETRAKYQGLERQFRPQYQAIHAEADEAIRNILNDEQKKRFEQIVREEGSRRRPRSPRGPK
jgi:Spy/CpxP family protein refolding chaperone